MKAPTPAVRLHMATELWRLARLASPAFDTCFRGTPAENASAEEMLMALPAMTRGELGGGRRKGWRAERRLTRRHEQMREEV